MLLPVHDEYAGVIRQLLLVIPLLLTFFVLFILLKLPVILLIKFLGIVRLRLAILFLFGVITFLLDINGVLSRNGLFLKN